MSMPNKDKISELEGKYGIRFTIPDAPPEKQLEQVKNLKEIVLLLAKVVGEEVDTKPFDETIEQLEAALKEANYESN